MLLTIIILSNNVKNCQFKNIKYFNRSKKKSENNRKKLFVPHLLFAS